MAWDKSKHKVLASKRVKLGDELVIVEIYSYNKGPDSIGLRTETTIKGEMRVINASGFSPEMGVKVGIALKKLCKEHLGIE